MTRFSGTERSNREETAEGDVSVIDAALRAPCLSVARSSTAQFVAPMLLLPTGRLPEGANWLYELKLEGYRAIAVKSSGQVRLWSRNEKDLSRSYPSIVNALAALPDETVIDGEIVALDQDGKPSFSALQNYGSAQTPLLYYIFDVLMLSGRDVQTESLAARRKILACKILPTLHDPIRPTPELEGSLDELILAVRLQSLEGLVAKRRDSVYESGRRSGAWSKMRVDEDQEFVIGGYTVGGRTFDSLVFGYYEGARLLYASRPEGVPDLVDLTADLTGKHGVS